MSYAGGGFMASQGSQGSPGDKRSTTSSLRPVTIKQLVEADRPHPDSEFTIDGVECKDVTFVACIRHIDTKSPTNVSLQVEDGTGQINVRKWIESGSEDAKDEFEENQYVRILGSIKTFNDKKHISANHIHVVEDKDEIQFHIIEVVHTHLALTKGPVQKSGGAPQAANSNATNNPYNNSNHNSNSNNYSGLYSELQGLQREIMVHIGEMDEDTRGEGVQISEVARVLGKSFPKVTAEIENLIGDGHLYNTLDENHVLPTA
ncbi:replication protein A, subunit RPA32 [Meredithblackwellia eburnea MCA 4105]